MNKMQVFKINLLIIIIMLAINLLSFNFLPNNVGLQLSLSGSISNYIYKPFFVILLPGSLFLITIYFYFRKNDRFGSFLIAGILCLIADIGIILSNINLFF